MKTIFLGLIGLVFCGVLVVAANPVRAERLMLELNPGNGVMLPEHEGIHAARVDMPSLIDMSHASPDTWGTLPPSVDTFEQLRAPAPPLDEYDIPDSMLAPISLAAKNFGPPPTTD
jgi:hypothetical protein